MKKDIKFIKTSITAIVLALICLTCMVVINRHEFSSKIKLLQEEVRNNER